MDKKEAKWIVKQMRKMYSDDRTILEIAKNSYHDNDNEQNKKIKILTILNETHTCVIIISYLCVGRGYYDD